MDKKNDFKDYLRLRTAFEYSIKNWDWDPYFSFEFFNKTTGSDLEKKRFGIGSSNKIKGSKWTLRYFYQVNRGNSKENFHIFILKYRYKQKAKSLKKQKDKKTPNEDVDELYTRVSKIDSKISIATIYRTVKLFEEAGILTKHDFKSGKARYELNDDHNHLIDIKTGAIIEFVDNDIEELQKKIADKYGYKLVDHKLELYGIKKK